MSTVQYSWLDVFRHIVYLPEVYISPSLLALVKITHPDIQQFL